MKATDADKEGKYEEAVKLYKEAFYYYIDAYKCKANVVKYHNRINIAFSM